MCSAAADANVKGCRGEGLQGRHFHLFTLSPFHPFIFLLLLLTGCQSVDPVVKVALVGPFEGQDRAIGYDVIYSARLAVREVNEAGGIGGYRVALVALDDGGDPELARQVAESLVIDPAVVAVVGHWEEVTTDTAVPIYTAAHLPIIQTGAPPFGEYDPALLPADFIQAYEAVTPFEETAGPYAAPAYDAFQLLWLALDKAAQDDPELSRQSVAAALSGLQYQGLTGTVYQP
ncbi:MAG: ABC transporter substrate-binding protein [Ardenticatenaceae bacterium]|nr:ABC transporter substrate-binding protein [Ardenticatenaceae bacterium]MCB9444906.1 ABC transporter substrate-binding protein [Ardenticatenaceae bacterium]